MVLTFRIGVMRLLVYKIQSTGSVLSLNFIVLTSPSVSRQNCWHVLFNTYLHAHSFLWLS